MIEHVAKVLTPLAVITGAVVLAVAGDIDGGTAIALIAAAGGVGTVLGTKPAKK
jgi:hypothetical protein